MREYRNYRARAAESILSGDRWGCSRLLWEEEI